jgi:tripartite ATP-independent transporter DctP family solute receptor
MNFIKLLIIFVFIGNLAYSKTTIRMATHVSVFSPLYNQMKMFSEIIEKKLPEKYNFKLYPSGQLGKEKALISNLKANSIEIITVASGVMKLDRKLGVFDLPWLFDDRAHVIRSLDAGLGKAAIDIIEKQENIKVLGIYENGFRHIINGVKAIKKPIDLKGLKIRISGGKFRQGVFRQMGAIPQKVAWKETFTSLQTGVVDGAEAAAYGFYEQKHYEVMKYLSLTKHVYTPSFMLISKKFLATLPKSHQKIFLTAAKNMTKAAFEQAANLETKYFKVMKSKLMINEVDLKAFQEKTKKSYTIYKKKYGNEFLDIVDSTR